jgi:exosortase A
MPPEYTPPEHMTLDLRSGSALRNIWQGLSDCWRSTLVILALGMVSVMAIAAREWSEMFHQWWNIDTYTHILLIPLIILWLVALKSEELAKSAPKPWLPGFVFVIAGLALWIAGRASGINLFAHAGAVGALQGVIITVLGPRVSLLLALPICLAVFLVPFGDEMVPALQDITAKIAIALTLWSGIPAVIDGIYIDTPVGLFIVAEACSGVKFLIAMVTLAVIVCFTRFESWGRRAVFLLASIIIPIIANGIRAWGTIYIAQSQGVEFAAGFDHIFYGWIFFAVVVAIVLAGAWRFFQREPEEFGWNNQDLESFAWLERLEAGSTTAIVAFAGITGLAIAAGVTAAIVAPYAIG